MRDLKSLMLLFLGLGSLFSSLATAQIPKKLAKPVFCEAMLWAGTAVPSTNPDRSLTQFIRDLRESLPPETHFFDKDRYDSIHWDEDLAEPAQDQARHELVASVVTRLTQLEADDPTVAFEFRGRENVRAVRDVFTKEAIQTNEATQAELRRRYPDGRWQTWLRHVLSMSLPMAPLLMAAQQGTSAPLVTLSAFGGIMGLAFDFGLPAFRSFSGNATFARQQIKQIDQTLASARPGEPISVYSGQVDLPNDLYHSLMNMRAGSLTEQDLEKLVDASENSVRGLFDRQPPERNQTRVYFDSIFYFDALTHEPVWLFYMRSHRLPPSGGGRRRVEAEDLFQSEAQPQLVPVRVKDR